MAYQLTFGERAVYDSLEPGIPLETVLRHGSRIVRCGAQVDTGSQYCVFSREIGEDLGLEIESGLRKELGSLAGTLIAYGHEVTLETLGLEFNSFVFFSETRKLRRNLLGRAGWLQLVRLAIIDYDQELYLSLYNDDSV